MRTRAILITTTLALLAGLGLYGAQRMGEAEPPRVPASPSAERLSRGPRQRSFSPPPSALPVSTDELHALLANPPPQPRDLPKDELALRALAAQGVEAQPRDVQRTYYRAQLEHSPRALTELSRSLDEVRSKLGEESEAYQELAQQLSDYKKRVDQMKQQLAALD
jgi:hypothetical protein